MTRAQRLRRRALPVAVAVFVVGARLILWVAGQAHELLVAEALWALAVGITIWGVAATVREHRSDDTPRGVS